MDFVRRKYDIKTKTLQVYMDESLTKKQLVEKSNSFFASHFNVRSFSSLQQYLQFIY